MDADTLRARLDVIYGAANATRALVEALYLDLEREAAVSARTAPLVASEGRCEHRRTQPASTMGGEIKAYCPDCRCYVYPDGREEPA